MMAPARRAARLLLATLLPLAARSAPIQCPSGNYCGGCAANASNWDTIHLMLGFDSVGLRQLHQSMAEAVSMFRAAGPGIRSDDVLYAHSTVQYLCCLTLEQLGIAAAVLAAHPLPRTPVRFEQVICETASFIALADNASQVTLGMYVAGVEDALLAAGVPVRKRRATQAPFHTTLATFGAEYAEHAAAALAAVNARFAENATAGGAFNAAPIEVTGVLLLPD